MPSALGRIPLFEQLHAADRILVTGCGGGFDIYCGLPLALNLWNQGKTVTLANLTFASTESAVRAQRVSDVVTRVDGDSGASSAYFPELYLARWLKTHGRPDEVYCLDRTGVRRLREAYQRLLEDARIDAIVVVDGGTDSLMRGDEAGLGTPHEDVSTLVALDALDLPRFLVCMGFGIDAYHGVCHAHFLENAAALVRSNAFLGTFSLIRGTPEVDEYLSAVEYATAHEPTHPSIVNTSIAAAITGAFGDHHPTTRTRGSELFINPLMSISWCFELQAVVDRLLYAEPLRKTETWAQVVATIHGIRGLLEGQRPYARLPL